MNTMIVWPLLAGVGVVIGLASWVAGSPWGLVVAGSNFCIMLIGLAVFLVDAVEEARHRLQMEMIEAETRSLRRQRVSA